MKLTDLEANFIRYETRIESYERLIGDPRSWKPGDPTETVTGPRHWMIHVTDLKDAQGITFLCPKCFAAQQHHVEITFANRGVSDDAGTHNKAGKPTRWVSSGTGVIDLTLTPSVLIEDGCGWHGFVTNGDAN